jgi:hypothetical protein
MAHEAGSPLRQAAVLRHSAGRGVILDDYQTLGDYSLLMPRPMGVWPAFIVQPSHFPGRAFERSRWAAVYSLFPIFACH